jgi:PBP1b-binding outer membrane lipoprotein LpoB
MIVFKQICALFLVLLVSGCVGKRTTYSKYAPAEEGGADV